MPVVISDETLRQVGLTEREVAIEIACHLFKIERLPLWPASQIAGMSRAEFEQELVQRRIPIHRPTSQDLADDLAMLKRRTTRP